VLELCSPALATGLPLLKVTGSTWQVAGALMNMIARCVLLGAWVA
jgi:hypothetical protein